MIDVKNIYKNFGSLKVLKAVSTTIEKGEKVVIIGPSGSGKSTLLRCMNLLEEPTYGEVWLDGRLITPVDPYLHRDVIIKSATFARLRRLRLEAGTYMSDKQLENALVAEIKKNDLLGRFEGREYAAAMRGIYSANRININEARRRMGMVFQNVNLFNNMTVMQNLVCAPVQLGIKTKEEAAANALRLLRRIGSALSRTLESQRAGAASRQSVAVGVGYRDYGVVKGSVNMRLTFVNLAYISLFSRYFFNCHVKPPYLAAFLLLETVRLGPFLVRAFCLDDCPRTGRFFLCLTPR